MAIGYQAWSSDSKYLYFDTQGNDSAFFRLHVRDGRVEKIVGLGGVQRAASNFGPWSGLAPDDSPLIVREVGTQEVYALEVALP